MSTSILKFVNDLSEIYSKNVEIKTANLNVSLKYLKIRNIFVIAMRLEKKQLKPINALIKKFPNTYKFYNISKFILALKKVLGKDLMKVHFQVKKLFTVNYIYKILLMKTIYMLKKYLKNLKLKT